MVYKWKEGSCFKADAGQCKAEIDQLPEKTRENIVKYARSQETELHKCFEWDDAKAAEQHRLDQAGEVLRSIVFVSVYQDEEVTIRAFERGNTENNAAYRNVMEALDDEGFRKVIINRLKRDIASIENIVKTYQRFFTDPSGVQNAVQKLKQAV